MDPLRLFRVFFRSEKGAELVEFAFTFPLLLLITMGMVDFGLMLQRYEVLTNASREGARVLVLPDYAPADVTPRVNQYLQGTSLSGAVTTSVGPVEPMVVGGVCITVQPVTVSYTHQFMLIGGLMSYFGSSIGNTTITSTTSMRHEAAAASCGP